jgi:hypothetical protein
MDEPERNYLRQQIQQLERSKGRWKLATIILAAILLINLIVGGASSLFLLQRQTIMMRLALDAERAARQQAEAARQQAEEAAHELRQKQKAEEKQQH